MFGALVWPHSPQALEGLSSFSGFHVPARGWVRWPQVLLFSEIMLDGPGHELGPALKPLCLFTQQQLRVSSAVAVCLRAPRLFLGGSMGASWWVPSFQELQPRCADALSCPCSLHIHRCPISQRQSHARTRGSA